MRQPILCAQFVLLGRIPLRPSQHHVFGSLANAQDQRKSVLAAGRFHLSGKATDQELARDYADLRRQYATRTVGSNNQTTIKTGATRNSTLMSPTIAASTPTNNSNAEIPRARTYPHEHHFRIPHAQSALPKARARNRKLASNIRGPTPPARLIETVLWIMTQTLSAAIAHASDATTQRPLLTISLTYDSRISFVASCKVLNLCGSFHRHELRHSLRLVCPFSTRFA